MRLTHIAKICAGQDGAIFGTELFRFDHAGKCAVYDLSSLDGDAQNELTPIAKFEVGGADLIVPHSNSVCFGSEYYDASDKYPLLYSNVYNNYSGAEQKHIGVCCVYRVLRNGNDFRADLVQLIEIGFVENADLWKVSEQKHGVRPYGNFVIDNESGKYYAFVMRDEKLGTRYFEFDLPSVNDGEIDARLGVRRAVLVPSDIKKHFDCSYHRFIQGAVMKGGKIYSTEGFGHNDINRPAIRIIDTLAQKELYFDLVLQGYTVEPELIDFLGDVCIYGDARGNLYSIRF